MKKLSTMIAGMTFVCAGAYAQDNPISTGTKTLYGMVKGNLLKAADKMPEENYSFKASPDIRTFGALIGHIADANISFCAGAKGDASKKPAGAEKSMTAKADLVAALKDSFAYCDGVYDSMTDAAGAEKIKLFGRDWSKMSVLDFNVAHDNEEYGYLAVYMRIKGIVPPSSDRSGK